MRRKRLIPTDENNVVIDAGGGRRVSLTNLQKKFWPTITKGDLLQYYADVSEVLLPHLHDRAMVMKRYPNGYAADFFFMKRAPTPRPAWIETVKIDHGSSGVIEFPMVQDLPSLLWVINLGCIDLNQWYGRCDEPDKPDYMHFDLDPGSATFAQVKEAALILRETLESLKMPTFVKTSGSKGIHVYVPIVRGPDQHQVHLFAKTIGDEVARRNPKLMTSVYVRSKRPKDRVLVDYNQNRWGATLASIYSVRPTPTASVSTPVTWKELPKVEIDDFRIDNVPARVSKRGDLWAGVVHTVPDRFDFGKLA
jgi:bifunctional non-homologous end joining protein LigD